jgi:hypothetical protein
MTTMPKSPGRTRGSVRIRPARIADLPTVLDSEQAANVLRVSREAVCRLANEGQLHRLAYSRRDFLFWQGEILRYLSEQSVAGQILIQPETTEPT